MKNAIIIGGGGHSLSMIDILLNSNEWNLIGYTDISNKGKIKNIPYIGNENKLNKVKCKNLFMGLSYLKTPLDRTLRFQIISELLNKGFVFPKLISHKSNLSKFLYLSFFIIVGCGEKTQTIEEKIKSHKNNIYELGDSLKMIDQKIDSLMKIYSK